MTPYARYALSRRLDTRFKFATTSSTTTTTTTTTTTATTTATTATTATSTTSSARADDSRVRHNSFESAGDTTTTIQQQGRSHTQPLVVQYVVQYTRRQGCAAAYVKLLGSASAQDLTRVTDKTPFTIMFGPDQCGTKKTIQFIFQFKSPVTGLMEEVVALPLRNAASLMLFDNNKPHILTLIMRPDNSFSIRCDGQVVSSGLLTDELLFEKPLGNTPTLPDPDDAKPDDWVDESTVVDESDVKPDDWDESQPMKVPDPTARKPTLWDESAPEMIPDASVSRPEAWNEGEDGPWEAPLIRNPVCNIDDGGCGKWSPPMIHNKAWRGPWRPRRIANPAYKGLWKPRRIKNPLHFVEPDPFSKLGDIDAVTFETNTDKGGVGFSDILITDDEAVALAREEVYHVRTASGAYGWWLYLKVMAQQNTYMYSVYALALAMPVVLILWIYFDDGTDDARAKMRADRLTLDNKGTAPAVRPDANIEPEAAEEAEGAANAVAAVGSTRTTTRTATSSSGGGGGVGGSSSGSDTKEEEASETAITEEGSHGQGQSLRRRRPRTRKRISSHDSIQPSSESD